MTNILQRITVENFRVINRLSVQCGEINVLCGPNGVGKTTFLDALLFLRDCAIRGTDQAASERHHGVGVLWDGAEPGELLKFTLETENCTYAVSFGFSSGRIEPFVGERLYSKTKSLVLVDRKIGSAEAVFFFHDQVTTASNVKLREPEKLAFSNYLLVAQPSAETAELADLFSFLRYYHSRTVNLSQLRRLGSESTIRTYLWDRWGNLWSALRNLSGRRAVDERYDQIVSFMREGFPTLFRDLVFDPSGPDRVTASFVEENRRQPIPASGVSDGHIQLLGLLTALFGDPQDQKSILVFDEPETSLHPHAIAVFAKAVQIAAESWNRQVFIATHSPVLMSQFREDETFVFQLGPEHQTQVTRLSDTNELRDLLDQFAIGSLFMSEALAPQDRSDQ